MMPLEEYSEYCSKLFRERLNTVTAEGWYTTPNRRFIGCVSNKHGSVEVPYFAVFATGEQPVLIIKVTEREVIFPGVKSYSEKQELLKVLHNCMISAIDFTLGRPPFPHGNKDLNND